MSVKIEAPGIILPRLKMHRQTMTAILNDSRISGSRRMLGQFLAVFMDLYEHPKEQQQVLDIITSAWGDAKRTRFTDDDEPTQPETQTNVDRQAVQEIKNIFDEALKERQNDDEKRDGSNDGG